LEHTTFLDYGSIEAKNEGYPIGKGGNGLIHKRFSHRTSERSTPWSVVAKLWNREPKQRPPKQETPDTKEKRLAARIEARNRSLSKKNLLGG